MIFFVAVVLYFSSKTGAVLNLDGGPLGLLGGLPGNADEQVYANVHRHHVRDAVPPDGDGDGDDYYVLVHTGSYISPRKPNHTETFC